MPQIIAIVLIRDEDLFIERVLRNVLDFCDQILVADNHSRDTTPAIVKRLASQYPKISYHVVDHPAASHDLIANFAGTDTWVFGVDGDEVYDPGGLLTLRAELLAGRHTDCFKFLGNVLNVHDLDRERHTARGYLAPPCRSMTKLYNFNAISAWAPPTPERLHGGHIVFRPGYGEQSIRHLHHEVTWNQSAFRCLHFCFSPRSSRDPVPADGGLSARQTIQEKQVWGHSLRARIKALMGLAVPPNHKQQLYARGPLVEQDVRAFGF